jgi:DNA-binding IclR family transcriptional regulator
VDETIALVIWTSGGPLVFEVSESSRPIVLTMKRGTLMPVLSTAAGIIFCAFLPAFQTMSLVELELTSMCDKNPIVRNKEELEAVLITVRQDGYALNRGHLLSDVLALAAPVYGYDRKVSASLVIFGREDRIAPERNPRPLKALLESTRPRRDHSFMRESGADPI